MLLWFNAVGRFRDDVLIIGVGVNLYAAPPQEFVNNFDVQAVSQMRRTGRDVRTDRHTRMTARSTWRRGRERAWIERPSYSDNEQHQSIEQGSIMADAVSVNCLTDGHRHVRLKTKQNNTSGRNSPP